MLWHIRAKDTDLAADSSTNWINVRTAPGDTVMSQQEYFEFVKDLAEDLNRNDRAR